MGLSVRARLLCGLAMFCPCACKNSAQATVIEFVEDKVPETSATGTTTSSAPTARSSAVRPTSSGSAESMSPDVQRVIAANRARITACYNQALVTNPAEAGTIDVQLEVKPSGAVGSAKALSTTVSPALTTCVIKTFERLIFAPEPTARRFVMPIVLASAK